MQVVVTSDRRPSDQAGWVDRLRSRFEWGLIVDITTPDLPTRIGILRRKAVQARLLVPPEVLELIAGRVTSSIRELEGALTMVHGYATANRSIVDLTLAEEARREILPDPVPEVSVERIIAITAAYFGVTTGDLVGHVRTAPLVRARQVAIHLARELTDLSMPRIGQAFGGRDHTTVMHADRKIRQLMAERRTLYFDVHELMKRIRHS